MKLHLLLRLLLLLMAGTCAAQTANEAAPVLDQRALHLAEQLRCVVCQNQTLADSHAELAQDLKRELQAQLARGASDQAVLDFMTERYGDFVRYRPPFKAQTWGLWLGPLVLLLLGGGLLRSALRQAQAQPSEPQERP